MQRIKQRLYEIVAEPPEGDKIGNVVNIAILSLIAVNVMVGILETVPSLNAKMPEFFYYFEFVSVIIFTMEYVLRMWACTSQEQYRHWFKGRLKLALTPMALIDLFAIAPFYLQVLLGGVDLRFIRVLRLFRLFRLFRMGRLTKAFGTLALVFRRKKEELYIAVVVLIIVVIFSASLMYLVESKVPGTKFTSVPSAMWWSIITVTTIGYGDMFPTTPLGQFLGALIGFTGVCVFALPVAILGAGFIEEVDPEFQLHPANASKDNEKKEASSKSPPVDSGKPEPLTSPSPAEAGPSTPMAEPVGAETPTGGVSPPLDDAFLDAVADRVASKIADQVADRVAAQVAEKLLTQWNKPSD